MNFDVIPLGPFLISVGGVILLIGFFLSSFFLIFTTRQKNLPITFLSENLFIFLLIPLLIGRIGSFIQMFNSFKLRIVDAGFLEKIIIFIKYFFAIWEGSIDPVWVILGFLIIFSLFSIWKKQSILRWLDAFVLPSIIAVIFVHIGGFFSAWGYGKPVNKDFFMAISYDLQNVRFSGPIHPVQIYGAVLYFVILLIGMKLWHKSNQKSKKWKDGTFFYLITFFCALLNGLLEFFRGNAVKIIFDFIRLPQALSFSLAVLSLIFFVLNTHKEKKNIHF